MSANNNTILSNFPSHALWTNVFQDKSFQKSDLEKEKIIKVSEKILKLDKGEETLKTSIQEFEKLLVENETWPQAILYQLKKIRHGLIGLPDELRKTSDDIAQEYSFLNVEDEHHFLALEKKGAVEKVNTLKKQCSKAFEQPKLTHHQSSWPPYDKTLVEFLDSEGKPGYFNASVGKFTDSTGCTRKMILSEAPKEPGEGGIVRCHFLSMVKQNKVGLIITVADPSKGYSAYWPENENPLDLGKFCVVTKDATIIATSPTNEAQQLVKRTLSIADKTGEWECIQLHMVNWMDMQACDPTLMKDLILAIYGVLKDLPEEKATLIHCLVGIGRTGVSASLLEVCGALIDQISDGIENFKLEPKIKERILLLRKEVRMGLVMTPDQYELIYKTMKKLFSELTKLDFRSEGTPKLHKPNSKEEDK